MIFYAQQEEHWNIFQVFSHLFREIFDIYLFLNSFSLLTLPKSRALNLELDLSRF